jgi:mono/diheme cytochrome c family protein
MKRIVISIAVIVAALVALTGARQAPALENAQKVERGKYIVRIAGCNDCHTPLKMGPKGPEPDMSRMLSGHPAQLVMPRAPQSKMPWMWTGAVTNTAFAGPWGISYARNLTPDQVSGLGIWNEEMFIKMARTGRHMGVSRPILPPMPWQNLNAMTDDDLKAVFAYLRTVKPIRNEVPDAVVAQ